VLGCVWRVRIAGVVAGLAVLCALYFRFAGSHARVIDRVEFREPSGKVLTDFFDGLPKDPRYDLKLIRAQVAAVAQSACSSGAPGFWSRILGKLSPVGIARAQGNCAPTQCTQQVGFSRVTPDPSCGNEACGTGFYQSVNSDPTSPQGWQVMSQGCTGPGCPCNQIACIPTCNIDSDCPTGKVCEASQCIPACTPTSCGSQICKSNGHCGPCTSGSDCPNGVCNAGTGNCGPCGTDSDCPGMVPDTSGTCCVGQCYTGTGPIRPGGFDCTDNCQCASGFCAGGTCSFGGGGGGPECAPDGSSCSESDDTCCSACNGGICGDTEGVPGCTSYQNAFGSWICQGTLCQNGCSTDGCSCAPGDPIVIDIAGQGYELTNAQNGVKFDFWGNNKPVQIAWTASGWNGGFLALDRNGNGKIDNGAELFGNLTAQPKPAAGQQGNGFLALAVFDQPANGGNGDGVIDSRDSVYSKLVVWVDKNHNGVSDPGELIPLKQAGVQSISLKYSKNSWTDMYGNKFRYRASLVRSAPYNPTQQWVYDVLLLVAPSH
jgi:hypothetical protein